MRVDKDFEQGRACTFSLWVTVERGVRSHVFELDGVTSRAIVIGSTRDAAHAVCEPDFAPIECFLEREGDEIWLVPGTPSAGLRVDDAVVERPMRLWRRCTLQVAGQSYVVRVREEPPTARDLEIPVRITEVQPQTLRGSGTLCGGFGLSALAPQLPPGVENWQAEPKQPISVNEIVAIGAIEPVGEAVSLPVPQPRFAETLEPRNTFAVSQPELPSRPLSARRTQSGLAPGNPPCVPRLEEPITPGIHPVAAPFRPAQPPRDESASPKPVLPRAAPLVRSHFHANTGHSSAETRGTSRARPYRFSDSAPASAPVSMPPLSAGPASFSPPSSAPAAVISIRAHSVAPLQQLERLGLFTRRRPLTVTLGAILGAAAIAFSLKLGTHAVLVMQRGSAASAPTQAQAQALAHTTRFCELGPGASGIESLRRHACRWLNVSIPSAPSLQRDVRVTTVEVAPASGSAISTAPGPNALPSRTPAEPSRTAR